MATVMTGMQSAPPVDRAPVQAEHLFYVIAAYTMLILRLWDFRTSTCTPGRRGAR